MPERSSADKKTPRAKAPPKSARAAERKPAAAGPAAPEGTAPDDARPKTAARRPRAAAAAVTDPPVQPRARGAAARARQTGETKNPQAPGDARERERLIAIAAYYIAERRGFAPGGELEDWLQAERAVDQQMRSRAD